MGSLADAPDSAVVFCAGEGSRLRPLTLDRPKPMVSVADRPILAYILDWLAEEGVRRVGINLHYRPEAIRDYVGDGRRWGLSVRYTSEDSLLGSAGALPRLVDALEERDGPFVAVYGDTLSTLRLEPLWTWHHRSRAALTMAVMEHPNPTEAGIVDFADLIPWQDGVAGRIRRIHEKPAPAEVFSTIANAGVFVIEPRALRSIAHGRVCDLARDLIPELLALGETVSAWRFPVGNVVWDVGTWPSYERAQREWAHVWASRVGRGNRSPMARDVGP